MRAFFGLSPDPKTKLAIETWRSNAFAHFDAPVSVANFHVTLAFLGQISDKLLERIDESAAKLSQVTSFDVSLDCVGYWSKPKALWLGSSNTDDQHLSLSKDLHKLANNLKLNLPKQDYVTHLTLARKCKLNPAAPLIKPNFAFTADQFHLFESVSSNHGVAYYIRQSWPLAPSFKFKSR
jgi:2'-5' RNA ligase